MVLKENADAFIFCLILFHKLNSKACMQKCTLAMINEDNFARNL